MSHLSTLSTPSHHAALTPHSELELDHLQQQMPTPLFKELARKVIEGERISELEGLTLYEYPETTPLKLLANARRRKICSEMVYYTSTIYIHPTNLCELSCPMCSYYAKPGWKSAWIQTPEEAFERILPFLTAGVEEVHVVGGLWHETHLNYYEKLFTLIRQESESVHIKALTPVEYDYLAQLHGIDVESVLKRMKSWGLNSIPGGGAEILVESIRKQIAPQKIDSSRFLQIHEIAHSLGIPSNITMLYGHVEEPQHIVEHLAKVRTQQDRSMGFQTFVPLKYHTENNALGKRTQRLKPKDPLKILALSRLMLDNIPHIKVLWNYVGADTALESLAWGVSDLGSTATEEKIIRMAGGTELVMDADGIEQLATLAGRPCKRADSSPQARGSRLPLRAGSSSFYTLHS